MPPSAPISLPLGARIDRYEILREIGRDEVGWTYLARHLLGFPVQIKELLPEGLAERAEDGAGVVVQEGEAERFQAVREVFEDEARGLSGLNHPALEEFVGFFEMNGTLYRVSRDYEARSLRDLALPSGPCTETVARTLLDRLIEALSHAHQCGVLHLNITPDTIEMPDRDPIVTGFAYTANYLRATRRKVPPVQSYLPQFGRRESDGNGFLAAEQAVNAVPLPTRLVPGLYEKARALSLEIEAALEIERNLPRMMKWWRALAGLMAEPGWGRRKRTPLEEYLREFHDSIRFVQGPWTDVHGVAATVYFYCRGRQPGPLGAWTDRIPREGWVRRKLGDSFSTSFCRMLEWALEQDPGDRPPCFTLWNERYEALFRKHLKDQKSRRVEPN